ncbi:DNA internalization-related competence protein ComEC/Rec2 [Alcaligenaceae bacterium CGII-47]|nr:DNA internalization-related competence protein ComEC/Rec2 [Alcaligenaceae bacterium CGII-47]
MVGRLTLLAYVGGVVVVHGLADLPDLRWPVLGAVVSCISLFIFWARPTARAGLCIAGAICLGFGLTVWQAQTRLADELAPGNVDRVSRLELRVLSLVRHDPDRRQFEAQVLSARPGGVPQNIMVSWSAGGWRGPYHAAVAPEVPFPEIAPGQVWRMALNLRPIRAAMNQYAFDYEGYRFAQGVRATGSVRGSPVLLRDEPGVSLSVQAERARHSVREAMQPYLAGMRYGPVLLALVIGDQAGVSAEDWLIFNRTGITHLVSISGSHITMIAALGGMTAFWLWRRIRWRGKPLAERLPGQIVGACAALIVAWLYCLLAGWGVPARRTFMMLFVVAACTICRLPISGSRVLALAAMVVVVLDPWAVLASGFWLSFCAVAVLIAGGARLDERPDVSAEAWDQRAVPTFWCRMRQGLVLATRLQLAITLALMPILAWIFHEVSIASPLANAYAIPVIGAVVTPLALITAALSVIPGAEWLTAGLAWFTHQILFWMMVPTVWLGTQTLSQFSVAAAPVWLYALAMAGVVWALWPTSLRCSGRWLGWLLMLPALAWQPGRPGLGEWDMATLDVGQGSAVLVRTANHTLLFDTGVRRSVQNDEGQRSILPFLRAWGIRKLDVLVVSHKDLDHVGGLRSVLAGMPVEQSYSSFSLSAWLRAEARKLAATPSVLPLAEVPCQYGVTWQMDGVSFEFLWPLPPDALTGAPRIRPRATARNEDSCVLQVRGAHHSLLLTGDIEAAEEAALLARGLEAVDVVVAAHHGSKTSSTLGFIERVDAIHVIAQLGSWNRYGHPADSVRQAWQRAGAKFWQTDIHGGVHAQSRPDGVTVTSVLESSRRYWHGKRQP